MTYTKPEVAVLGAAEVVIQIPSKVSSGGDGGLTDNVPAYDLDE